MPISSPLAHDGGLHMVQPGSGAPVCKLAFDGECRVRGPSLWEYFAVLAPRNVRVPSKCLSAIGL